MPVTASLIGGGASILGGVIKGLVGGGQRRKGRKLLDSLQYPEEKIPTEITDAANTGLPSEQYNQAMRNIQRQQLTALKSSQDRRGGLSVIPTIQQGTNDATLNLDVANANARQQNQFRLAGWKDKVWQNNVKDKYNRDYAYGMGLLGQGNQNLYNGIDQGIAGAGMIGYGLYGQPSGNSSTTGGLAVDNTNQGAYSSYRRGYMV